MHDKQGIPPTRRTDPRGVLEGDFNLDALALDPAYPLGVLRRSGLLPSDRILAISG
jgi:hypothetical protein